MRDVKEPKSNGRKSNGFISKTKSMLFSRFRDRKDSGSGSSTTDSPGLTRHLYPSTPDISVNGTHVSRIQVNGDQTPRTPRDKLKACSVAEDLSRVGVVRCTPDVREARTQWRPAADVLNGHGGLPTPPGIGYAGISKTLHGYGAAYRSPSRGRAPNGSVAMDLTKRFEAFSLSTPTTRRNSLSDGANGTTTPSPRNGTSNGTSNGTHAHMANGKTATTYSFVVPDFVVPDQSGDAYEQITNEVIRTLQAHVAEATRLLDAGEEVCLSESSADVIRVASGNSQLLIRKKLKKFGELVELNNNPSSGPTVHVDDLRGFWDMMEPDLNQIRKAFSEVERHRLNGWTQPSDPDVKLTETPKRSGPKPPVPPKPRAAPLRNASADAATLKKSAAELKRKQEREAFIRAKREAAKKAHAQQNQSDEINGIVVNGNGNGVVH